MSTHAAKTPPGAWASSDTTPTAPPTMPRTQPAAKPPPRPTARKSRDDTSDTRAAPKRKAPMVNGARARDAPTWRAASGADAVMSVDAVSVHAQHPQST